MQLKVKSFFAVNFNASLKKEKAGANVEKGLLRKAQKRMDEKISLR
jgi:hypothetical protein